VYFTATRVPNRIVPDTFLFSREANFAVFGHYIEQKRFQAPLFAFFFLNLMTKPLK